MAEKNERRIRKYVPVTLRVDENGKITPLIIEFDEQHKYLVDKVTDVRRAACQSAGGVGDRFTCRISGKEAYLWLEKGRWFIAAKPEYLTGQERGGNEAADQPDICS
ncbi:MAG: hypothetical protein IJV64_03100 [Oscillospiraceae bacterium]|nr:hypothetical protein [Oscillospiraceae bacterium]